MSSNSAAATRAATARLMPAVRSGPSYAIAFTAVAVFVQLQVGAYATDRGLTNDEAAHFVNSLLVLDYLRQGTLGNPLAFARNY